MKYIRPLSIHAKILYSNGIGGSADDVARRDVRQYIHVYWAMRPSLHAFDYDIYAILGNVR